MLVLPDVTLVLIDTIYHKLAMMAVEDSCQGLKFAKVIVFTDKPEFFEVDEIVKVEARTVDEAQRILWYKVPEYVNTSHILTVQWDGWVVNPQLWSNNWLNYDYIGAPWNFGDGLDIGNGGFSLRSKKLMKLLATDSNFPYLHPEDGTICRKYRRELESHGFKWPDRATAQRFSFENAIANSFGFHQMANWLLVLGKDDFETRKCLLDEYTNGDYSNQSSLYPVRELAVKVWGEQFYGCLKYPDEFKVT